MIHRLHAWAGAWGRESRPPPPRLLLPASCAMLPKLEVGSLIRELPSRRIPKSRCAALVLESSVFSQACQVSWCWAPLVSQDAGQLHRDPGSRPELVPKSKVPTVFLPPPAPQLPKLVLKGPNIPGFLALSSPRLAKFGSFLGRKTGLSLPRVSWFLRCGEKHYLHGRETRSVGKQMG